MNSVYTYLSVMVLCSLVLYFLPAIPSYAESEFSQKGIASWYGKKWHGRKTASGAVFNMHLFTAAHKTLPLGTRLRVTNVRNGRSVKVLVTDRGPYVKNRIIDLSRAAAIELGLLRKGLGMVKLEVLSYP